MKMKKGEERGRGWGGVEGRGAGWGGGGWGGGGGGGRSQIACYELFKITLRYVSIHTTLSVDLVSNGTEVN